MSRTTLAAFRGPVLPSHGALRPLGLDEVRITGGLWADRQEINARATLPHIGSRLESEGWLPNFDRAASGTLPDGRRGREFSDSEIYKYLEAMAWELSRVPDAALEDRFRAVVARVAAAQEADGYLNTMFGRPGQGERWSDLEWGHELYCLGHLFQAAVARERTRPGADDGLIEIACRAADLVCETFGEGANPGVCGHAEIEVGLAELARVTGRRRYLDQAALFVERRGRGILRDIEWGRSYYQDDIPVRDAAVLRGHAVRANYLAAGAVDVAIEHGDADLLESLRRQWRRTVARRTYITGGQGSHHQDEAFGEDWELPPDRAYSETCAGIGSIMFAWRLLLAEQDADAGAGAGYADLIERTLYNVLATGAAEDGRSYFYANTLHQRVPGEHADPDETSLGASASLRASWFEVSCCPPNVARTFASLAAYIATADAGGIQLHQYAPTEIRTTLDSGAPIALNIATRYPERGVISVTVRTTPAEPWTLSLRVPSWAKGARLRVRAAGTTRAAGQFESETEVEPGTAVVHRAFDPGDVVELDLPVQPRFSVPDPRIDAVRGSVAIERGPEVLALESVDLGPLGIDDVGDVVLDAASGLVERDGRVWATLRTRSADADGWPYRGETGAGGADAAEVALVPYRHWANRGPSTMRVFLPVE